MRGLFVCATLFVLLLESHACVPSQKNETRDALLAKIANQQLLSASFSALLNRTADLKLVSDACFDDHGQPIIGIVADKSNCRNYIYCAPGMSLVGTCCDLLLYSERLESCEWPHDADCIEYRAANPRKLVVPAGSIHWDLS